jgi:hypothetical protein
METSKSLSTVGTRSTLGRVHDRHDCRQAAVTGDARRSSELLAELNELLELLAKKVEEGHNI